MSLDDNVPASDHCEDSLHWQSGSDDECSSEMDLIRSVKTSSLGVLGIVNVLDSPFLTDREGLLGDNHILTFDILSILHSKDSAILNIDEVALVPSELLEPLSVGLPDLHVVGFTCSSDVERLVVEHLISDGK
jgi:hypothetical protein